jgi:hypothetical protein
MALLNAMPAESPVGIGVARGALLTTLLDKLVANKTLSHDDAVSVIRTALALVSGFSDSAPHASARVTLKRLLKDRGAI